jgi:hypothetical protein
MLSRSIAAALSSHRLSSHESRRSVYNSEKLAFCDATLFTSFKASTEASFGILPGFFLSWLWSWQIRWLFNEFGNITSQQRPVSKPFLFCTELTSLLSLGSVSSWPSCWLGLFLAGTLGGTG